MVIFSSRFRIIFIATLFFTVTVLSVRQNTAQAQTNRFSVIDNFPTIAGDGLFYISGTDTLVQNSWAFQSFFDYSYRPLELTAAGTRVQGVIDHLAVQYLGVAYAPTSRWQMDVELPIFWVNSFTTPVVPSPTGNEIGVGDVFLRSHFNIVSRENLGWGFSFNPYLTLPTGNENHYSADGLPHGGATFTLDSDLSSKWYVALSTGLETRERIVFNDLNRRDRWFLGEHIGSHPYRC